MEARVVTLERNFDRMAEALARIEKGQDELRTELRDLRRDLKEVELPAIKADISALSASLKEKPSASDLQKLVWSIFGFVLSFVVTIVGAAWVLKKIGLI